jgi:hypothetical protein
MLIARRLSHRDRQDDFVVLPTVIANVPTSCPYDITEDPVYDVLGCVAGNATAYLVGVVRSHHRPWWWRWWRQGMTLRFFVGQIVGRHSLWWR